MPRTKGSKNKPKITNDFASQIAEKQSAKKAAAAEISSITANIDALKPVQKCNALSICTTCFIPHALSML